MLSMLDLRQEQKYLFLHLLAILFSWRTIKWFVSRLLIDIFGFSIFSIIILGAQTSKQLAFTLDSLIIALVPYPIWWSLSCIVNKIKTFPPTWIQCLLLFTLNALTGMADGMSNLVMRLKRRCIIYENYCCHSYIYHVCYYSLI